MIDRLFLEHPRSVGETYRQHFGVAAGTGLVMLGTAFALFVHALVPALFVRTGSATIKRLYGQLRQRQPLLAHQAPAYATQDWQLEYEI
jgi:hypothetical protein